jgi:NCS1 family nucleobase:cation symporter-1
MDSLKSSVRERASRVKQGAYEKRKVAGWVLPKESDSFSPEGTWTNIDMDVTPVSRRTWTSWTMLAYWFSDIVRGQIIPIKNQENLANCPQLTAQGWEGGSAIISAGLTWRETLLCTIMGIVIIVIPMVFNGAIGAKLHVPFPVAARSAFGYQFAKFAVVVRLITALFWHSIQSYSGGTAVTQMIRAIWPSYLLIPNHLPASAGVSTQGNFHPTLSNIELCLVST